MGKLVILKIGDGNFEQGFPVTLQIGDEGDTGADRRLAYHPFAEVTGRLPANPTLQQIYREWQTHYRCLGLRMRLEAPAQQVTNVSVTEDCTLAAQALSRNLNEWLKSESFRPIREKWLEQLYPTEPVRVIVQTQEAQLQRLPWHLWDLFERFSQAEIALSLPIYQHVMQPPQPGDRVKILAVLGNSQGIDVQADRQLLEQLPNADVCFLVEPSRQTLTQRLWSENWDILFFAGHSSSQPNTEFGQLFINPTESLTIDQLRYALRKAVERRLKLAIFNSCDGLGLARNLADLQIPQMIVMREPVPDPVAQSFLKSFLQAFSRGETFYLAVREAREQLQGLEDRFPCATWLPAICQNPATVPPTWQSILGQTEPRAAIATSTPATASRPEKLPLRKGMGLSAAVGLAVCGLRLLGVLQPVELSAFDQMMRSRPVEPPDSRILIVGITDEDIRLQERGTGILSDDSLNQMLNLLNEYQPSAIGLDTYRDFAVSPDYPDLATQLNQTENVVAICKASDPQNNVDGIEPPPEVPVERLGFSDFWEDPDGVLRRQVQWMTPDPASYCPASYALSVQLAFRYLSQRGIEPTFTANGDLQLGETVFRRLTSHWGGYQGVNDYGSQIMVNYRRTPMIASQVSLTQLLSGQVNPDAIKDKIVLIGATTFSAGDIWVTPFGTGPSDKKPGVLVHAQMISQILSAVLDQRPLLWVWHPAIDAVWISAWSLVGGGLALVTLVLRKRLGRSLLLGVAMLIMTLVLLYGICLAVLMVGGWLPFIPAALALVASDMAAILLLPAPRSLD